MLWRGHFCGHFCRHSCLQRPDSSGRVRRGFAGLGQTVRGAETYRAAGFPDRAEWMLRSAASNYNCPAM